ncbi:hypothetical protein [Cohnella sp. 56]|uniref:hypothetical protein n=1 Tax=Cohnella sp. 56 TaxID=3113722 RepID=UPI0030EA56CF
MSRLNAEWEAKLAMLKAIARSQEALARLLESAADVSAAGLGVLGAAGRRAGGGGGTCADADAVLAAGAGAAAVHAPGNPAAAVLREHVRVLSGLQAAIADNVAGISWRPPREGVPAEPWLLQAAAVRLTVVQEPAGAVRRG